MITAKVVAMHVATTTTSRLPVAPVGPRRIVRSETVRVTSLSLAQRTQLLDRMYAIYSATMFGHTRRQFEQHLLGAGELRLMLYYDACGEIAGFACITVQFIEHNGKATAAFSAGGFFRPGYKNGGVSGIFFGLREALRFKLRRPGTALGCLARTSSPVAYQLFMRTMPKVYPSRTRKTPVDIDALVFKLAQSRGYRPIGEDPWVVRSDALPHNVFAMRRLDDHPDVRFFRELIPHEDGALLVWIPLTAATIAGGLYRQLRLRLWR